MSIDITGFEPKAPVALDSSMVGTYLQCPQKFYLEYVLGLRRSGERVALTFGTLWHEVMEKIDLDSVQDAVDLIQANMATFSIHDPKNRTAQRMMEDIAAYMIEVGPERNQTELVSTEQAFDIELPNGTRWCGRMDRVERKAKEIWIRDYKSTTFFTKNYFENHELGIQIKGYVWALNQLMPQDVVEGAIIDVYHILKNDTKFHRRRFAYRPSLISEWETNICHITDRIHFGLQNHLEDPEWWYMNGGQRCSDYGGCQYLLVHQLPSDRGNRERLLKHEFTVDRWDPVTHEVDKLNKPEG